MTVERAEAAEVMGTSSGVIQQQAPAGDAAGVVEGKIAAEGKRTSTLRTALGP
jgi:hypothetical protein